MKLPTLKLALSCLALAVMPGVALAQVIPLSNPGFEDPNLGKITNGFSGGGVTGWSDTGVTYVDTGVELGGHSGSYEAYEQASDDGAYQIPFYQIQSGDRITLTWWSHGTWNGSSGTFDGTGPNDPVQWVALLSAPYPGAPFSSTAALAVMSNSVPSGNWVQYSLTYTNTLPGDVGQYIGVAFVTSANSGKITNCYAAYDDFAMAAMQPNSLPIIVTPPASQTAFVGATVTFTATAIGATGYQWKAGAVGSGVYTNLSNGGQFSGVDTTTLTITNVTITNNADYVIVATNTHGSVTSAPPANLTVAAIIYRENFNMPTQPDQMVTNVGWVNDVYGQNSRIFTGNEGVTYPNNAVYSWVSYGGTTNEAFYATTLTANGGPYGPGGSITGHMAFPGINLATVQNLSFLVDMNTGNNGASTRSYFAVQMNSANWYVSTTELLPRPANTTFVTHSMVFSNSASAWNQLTVSGVGALNTVYPILGPAATGNLVGYITGIGIVCVHTGNSTMDFDNYTVLGAIPPSPLPVINSPPSSTTNFTGTTAMFSVSAASNGVTAGLTYQWKAGTVGSGVYTNLPNSGQFSGVTNSQLRISTVSSAANHKDYVVVVSDAAGSVTSAPPATLTVVDGPPVLTADAVIYPDAAPDFATANMSVHAGNNNTLHLTATFVGSQPIHYQWQIATDTNGTGAVNLSSQTNSTLTLANPQTNASGYYSLQATNSQSAAPTNSSWVQVTVLPASTALIQWSAPVSIRGLTASQILCLPGAVVGAESFGATSNVTVVACATNILFDYTGAAATLSGSSGAKAGVYTGPSTGDSNLDAVLSVDVENGGEPTLTLNNLNIGQLYSAQLFAINDVAGATRVVNWSDPLDAADVSPTFAMGDDVYELGTFTATAVTQDIQYHEVQGGYVSAVVIRAVPPTPTLSLQKVGSNLQVTYSNGTLLQAPSLRGPWTVNSSPSPVTVSPSGSALFFRVQSP